MQGKGGPGKGRSRCKDPDLEGVRCAPGLERRIPECWENGCWRREGGSVITILDVFLLLLAVKRPIEVLRRWRKDRQEEWGIWRGFKGPDLLILNNESDSVGRSIVPDCFRPLDYSLQGSSVHGFLQARILEWVAIPFSWESPWPRGWTQVSCIAGRFFTIWATREALLENELALCKFDESEVIKNKDEWEKSSKRW